MRTIRIIPRLDIKGENLVKGIHLEGLRILGKPEDFAEYYYQNGADELFYQDVVASLYGRNSLEKIISATAKKIFIPITVGGGIRSVEDINQVLKAGADRVSINTAAVKNPDFIKRAVKKFGSSTIVISIDVIKQATGEYHVVINNGREETGLEVIQWAKKMEEYGAGELLITSVDNEGTGIGYDLELLDKISKSINIPFVANGGAGKIQDCIFALQTGCEALSMASILHYSYLRKKPDSSILVSSKINTCEIKDLKKAIQNKGINIRV